VAKSNRPLPEANEKDGTRRKQHMKEPVEGERRKKGECKERGDSGQRERET
jgi:hypothetical protein